MSKYITIKEETLNIIAQYLSTKPYNEVVNIFSQIHRDIAETQKEVSETQKEVSETEND